MSGRHSSRIARGRLTRAESLAPDFVEMRDESESLGCIRGVRTGQCRKVRPAVAVKPLLTVANWVLDPSIVFSFDRTGYRRHAHGFDQADLDVDLTDRVCVVTGANSGIGYETSLAFAK